MQECVVDAITSIDIGSSIKEERDTLTMAMSSCKMESCMVRIVTGSAIGFSIKEELDALGMAFH